MLDTADGWSVRQRYRVEDSSEHNRVDLFIRFRSKNHLVDHAVDELENLWIVVEEAKDCLPVNVAIEEA